MKIVSLFAGAGGEVLGAHRAGLEHVEAVEFDAKAAEVLRNVHHHPAWGGPPLVVREESVADWSPPAADIWWASPPCQPDSNAGHLGGSSDARDGWPLIWKAYDRAEHKPTWLVCETVTGILSKNRKARWEAIVKEARKRFDNVVWKVLDTADFGVPQHRKRVILVCGPTEYTWPERTHGSDQMPFTTMTDVLGMDGTTENGRVTQRPRPMSEPASTISTRGNQMANIKHPDGHIQRRRLTVEECAVLQGFPSDWPFVGTKGDQYRQLGNAVPPALATAVLLVLLVLTGPRDQHNPQETP